MCECQICIKVNKLKVLLLILHLYFSRDFKIPSKNSTLYRKTATIRTSDSVTYNSFRYTTGISFLKFI